MRLMTEGGVFVRVGELRLRDPEGDSEMSTDEVDIDLR